MKSFRDIRVIPVVLVAIFGLMVLKIAGLVLDGGYVFDYQPSASSKPAATPAPQPRWACAGVTASEPAIVAAASSAAMVFFMLVSSGMARLLAAPGCSRIPNANWPCALQESAKASTCGKRTRRHALKIRARAGFNEAERFG